jgi:hypothetical protein
LPGIHKEFEMLKKMSKKGVLLFAGVLAFAAFAMPSMASAASWGVVGSTHVLDSPNLQFVDTNASLGGAGSTCGVNQFHTVVSSSSVLTVTATNFSNCMGLGAAVNCTTTPTGTSFPWSATGVTTTNIQLSKVHVTVIFENTPGNATACALPGAVTLSGTLASPGKTHWDALAHQVTTLAATGLVANTSLTTGDSTTISGTLRDTSQTLVLS